MKQAKQPSSQELSEGYETVPMDTGKECQPNNMARLNGKTVDLEGEEIEAEYD